MCPTCGARNAFARSDMNEALKIIGEGEDVTSKEQIIDIWEEFIRGKEFTLNKERHVVETLASGVLENQKNHGLRFCPCRITTGDLEKDLKLVCPCNFPAQKIYKEESECWCSLFVKR
ncbi:MAG TPA: ferredoxin-thioredoxin reductase catalytic domain-containing protein [Methanomassiliicoccales archaeon]|nr:ferredoxin-thioredoxin reductase catalytic domain-containing protein [Methanomassiliicoccales archaeon]